ncbi:MAG: hypothetical protein D6743_07270 [Calditrichaeota bacterium]|nr:MAG: hypothetical protein D6743_07270 [Calditrichota bacterium]
MTQHLAATFRQVLGDQNVVETAPVMGGEDFGRFGREEPRIPICMFWLGTVDPAKIAESQRTGRPLPSLHSSLYAPVPEPSIKTGVRAMSAAALSLLANRKTAGK